LVEKLSDQFYEFLIFNCSLSALGSVNIKNPLPVKAGDEYTEGGNLNG
jgi:hypothetical protein